MTRKRSTPHPSVQNAATGQPGASESTPVSLTIPGKPISTNQTYRTGGGRWFKDPAAAAWQARISFESRRAMKGRAALTGEVEVEITFWFDSRRPDADGPTKGLLDRLAPWVYGNDRQVTAYRVVKRLDKLNPRTEVTVRPWPPVVVPVADWHDIWDQGHGGGPRQATLDDPTAGRAYHEGAP